MTIIQPTRRKMLGGLGLLFCAPAIVKAPSLMPVKSLAHLEGEPILLMQSVTWYRLRTKPLTLAEMRECWNWVKENPLFPTAAGESAA